MTYDTRNPAHSERSSMVHEFNKLVKRIEKLEAKVQALQERSVPAQQRPQRNCPSCRRMAITAGGACSYCGATL